jgi:hypothetical protein
MNETPMARASRLEKEIRLTRVEEMMLAGSAPARIDRELQTKHGLSTRQARRYMAEVRDRWAGGKREDLLHRREKLLRMHWIEPLPRAKVSVSAPAVVPVHVERRISDFYR